MLRGLAVLVIQIVLTPLFALTGVLIQGVRPQWEVIPRIGRAWSRIILRVGGVNVVVRGAEIVERCRPAVVVGNHTSHLDSYVSAVVVPQPIRYVAKSSLFRIPMFGLALRAAGFIPLDRLGSQDDIDRLDALLADLARGAVVVFFPEGTRSRDGRLRPFKKGGFVTAIRSRVAIVPMVIAGAHRVHPRGGLAFHPGTVTVTFLEPIETSGLTFDDRHELVSRVHALFADALPPDQRPAAAGGEPGDSR